MVYDEFQACRLGEKCKNIFDLSSSPPFFNPRTYMQIHTPTEVQGGGGGGGEGWMDFTLSGKPLIFSTR